ncbi:hypothetical protein LBMAG42_30900 [Deltaproteobacteria bacterium]|nr:hypothetical protein LBMAG42_30900 [Deltaproteobacteria bacterium]
MRLFLVALAFLGFAGTAVAKPADPAEGVPVKVVVKDDEGTPIPTAVVRHPLEQDRHRVNSVDGSWETSVLYMPDGTELRFTPGQTVELEISAPGYVTQVFQYQIRKRRNVVELKLHKIENETEQIEEPMVTFGRDVPREPTGE